MKADQVSIITAHGHGLSVGDVIEFAGALHEVKAVTRDSFSARRLGLLEQLWQWLRSSIRISGFWARVWNR
jgi:hypothetical protein